MKVLLLPGLDGTGLLFKNLVELLPKQYEVEVVSYEYVEGYTYLEQAEELALKYQNEELFIVEESYSERVVYELYQLLKSNVKGIVFLASFISRPSVMSRLASMLPVRFISANILTKPILYVIGFNFAGGRHLVNPVFESLKKANKVKLKSRLCNLAYLQSPKFLICCPVVSISPSKDWLVSRKAERLLASKCTNYKKVLVKGGHFIAQSNPERCAEVINSTVSLVSKSTQAG